MTRSKLRKLRRNQVDSAHALLRRALPLAGAMLAGHRRRAGATGGRAGRPRRSGRHRAEARREPAGRAAVSIQAIGTEQLDELNVTSFDDYVKYLPSVSYPEPRPRLRARRSCAASPAATTATTPVRCPASASISTSSRSRRSRARSTSTSTTSRASKRSRVRRARCTARARRRAPSASSPTSRIQRASRRATTSRATRSPTATSGYLGEGFVNIPLGDSAAIRLVGWVDARRRLHRQRALRRARSRPPASPSTTATWSRTTTTTGRHLRRARRAQDRPQRQLDASRPASWPEDRRRNGVVRRQIRSSATSRSRTAIPRTPTTTGRRPR